jgi:hypothetical protein
MATGVAEGSTTELGTSDLTAATGLDLGGSTAEFGGRAEGALVTKPAAGLLAGVVGPGAPLGVTGALRPGFVAELPPGLLGEFVVEAEAGFGNGGAGLGAELVAGAGRGLGCLGDGAPAEVAPAPDAGGFNSLRMAFGFTGACCAIRGIASDDNQSATTQVFRFAFGMILFRSRIFSSASYFAAAEPGRAAVLEPAGGVAGVLVVKKVVIVQVPLTVVLGRTG